VGIFHDAQNLRAIWTSFQTAFWVSVMTVLVGTCAAFLFEQEKFPFKGALYFLMLAPLVIPGVILGISQLLAANTAGFSSKTPSGWTCPSCARASGWWSSASSRSSPPS
jgi:spermidine/putrescine transport system permease protein